MSWFISDTSVNYKILGKLLFVASRGMATMYLWQDLIDALLLISGFDSVRVNHNAKLCLS